MTGRVLGSRDASRRYCASPSGRSSSGAPAQPQRQLDELVERWQKLDEAAGADAVQAVPLARSLLDLVRPPPAPNGATLSDSAERPEAAMGTRRCPLGLRTRVKPPVHGLDSSPCHA